MIENIIFLLVANTLAPYIFFPPAILTPLPFVQKFIEPPTVLQNMNLPRVYQPQEFRKAFKQSLRTHHPDHGGQQQVFQQIQGLKKIMNQQTNYYDLYNITDSDISATGMKLNDVIQLKRNSFYTQTGIFYFIAFLYILSFTIDTQATKSRRIMLAITTIFVVYEFYIHQSPKSPTIIDLIYDKIPLFIQRKYLRRALIIWLALIRAYFSRKTTEEEKLLKLLKQEKPQNEYKDMLQRLLAINTQKLNQKIKYEKSWAFKIRNWVSKGISAFFFLILIKNMIPGLNFF